MENKVDSALAWKVISEVIVKNQLAQSIAAQSEMQMRLIMVFKNKY
jgi:hypothetical protein